MKSARKLGVWCVLCLVLILLLPAQAYADTGPKPSVQITLENMDGRVCYGTLLSKTDKAGPAFVWDGKEENICDLGDDHSVWQAFVDYQDADGFYFLQNYWRCDESGEISWGYYPPQTFKVLLYYPETEEFAVSEILERYSFDSYYTLDLKNGGMSARKSYDYTREIAGLTARLILTILIELGVALLFGLREKRLLVLITGVNAVTQVAMNAALFFIYHADGPWALLIFYIPLELAIFIVEAVVYCRTFRLFTDRKISTGKTLLYAFAANAASFALGWLIARFIPGIF